MNSGSKMKNRHSCRDKVKRVSHMTVSRYDIVSFKKMVILSREISLMTVQSHRFFP